jgi:hypothetical protein
VIQDGIVLVMRGLNGITGRLEDDIIITYNNNNNIYAGEPRRVPSCESNPPGGGKPQAGVALQYLKMTELVEPCGALPRKCLFF